MKKEFAVELLQTHEIKSMGDVDSNILKLEMLKTDIEREIIHQHFYKVALTEAITKKQAEEAKATGEKQIDDRGFFSRFFTKNKE